ncbi:MAG: hypothetical protein GJ680_18370 [Alteromonadaceae bacterium]|nr:hypothetical protein [Alteromonadaceae bacterium]
MKKLLVAVSFLFTSVLYAEERPMTGVMFLEMCTPNNVECQLVFSGALSGVVDGFNAIEASRTESNNPMATYQFHCWQERRETPVADLLAGFIIFIQNTQDDFKEAPIGTLLAFYIMNAFEPCNRA